MEKRIHGKQSWHDMGVQDPWKAKLAWHGVQDLLKVVGMALSTGSIESSWHDMGVQDPWKVVGMTWEYRIY